MRTEADLTLKWMMTDLSDDLGCLEEDGWGNGEAESFSRLQIDHQIKRGGLLDEQVRGLGVFQYLIHIRGNTL